MPLVNWTHPSKRCPFRMNDVLIPSFARYPLPILIQRYPLPLERGVRRTKNSLSLPPDLMDSSLLTHCSTPTSSPQAGVGYWVRSPHASGLANGNRLPARRNCRLASLPLVIPHLSLHAGTRTHTHTVRGGPPLTAGHTQGLAFGPRSRPPRPPPQGHAPALTRSPGLGTSDSRGPRPGSGAA